MTTSSIKSISEFYNMFSPTILLDIRYNFMLMKFYFIIWCLSVCISLKWFSFVLSIVEPVTNMYTIYKNLCRDFFKISSEFKIIQFPRFILIITVPRHVTLCQKGLKTFRNEYLQAPKMYKHHQCGNEKFDSDKDILLFMLKPGNVLLLQNKWFWIKHIICNQMCYICFFL